MPDWNSYLMLPKIIHAGKFVLQRLGVFFEPSVVIISHVALRDDNPSTLHEFRESARVVNEDCIDPIRRTPISE